MREEFKEGRKERERETEEGESHGKNSSAPETDKTGILWPKERHGYRIIEGNKLEQSFTTIDRFLICPVPQTQRDWGRVKGHETEGGAKRKMILQGQLCPLS